MNIITTITAVHAFLAEIKCRNQGKTASIAHVFSESWHETAPKGARKTIQESFLRSILRKGISCSFFLAPLGAFRDSVFETQAINSSEFLDKEYLAALGRAQASLALLLLARYFFSF